MSLSKVRVAHALQLSFWIRSGRPTPFQLHVVPWWFYRSWQDRQYPVICVSSCEDTKEKRKTCTPLDLFPSPYLFRSIWYCASALRTVAFHLTLHLEYQARFEVPAWIQIQIWTLVRLWGQNLFWRRCRPFRRNHELSVWIF